MQTYNIKNIYIYMKIYSNFFINLNLKFSIVRIILEIPFFDKSYNNTW